jgi:hypothetical protein
MLLVSGILGLTQAAFAGLDVLYTTGEPMPVTVIADGTLADGGYISGFVDTVSPKRHTATAFTLTEEVVIEEVVVYWFDNSDNPVLLPTTNYGWFIFADDAGGGPGTILAGDIFNGSAIANEEWIEPVLLGVTDWKRRFPLNATLAPGTYWITFYGKEGAIAWLTGAEDGWPELWRATTGLDYTLYTNTIWETPEDPENVYHPAFELLGSVVVPSGCEGDANGDGIVDPLDSGFALSRFGCAVGTGDPDCDAADQNGDGIVDPLDVGFILSRFGNCPASLTGPSDEGPKGRPSTNPNSSEARTSVD